MDKKYLLFAGIGLLVAVVLIAGILFFRGNNENMENKNNKLFIQEVNPKDLPSPNLPEADIGIMVNGEIKELKVECNSQVLKCTKEGYKEIC